MLTNPWLAREALPGPGDRRRLGNSELMVSPLCVGITGEPEIVPAAYDAGVNFFFLSGDLHWPLYEGVRRGLEMLLERGGSIRETLWSVSCHTLTRRYFRRSSFMR